MTIHLPQGDLARCITHESDDTFPSMIEIVAWWGHDGERKGRRCSIEITADQFFGRGSYGAPMGGGQLIGMIEQLRKAGAKGK
jgi:hypothetical protein